MPLRSVYAVDIDDSKVRDFFSAFSAHREEVNSVGADWVKASQRAGTATQAVTDYLKQFGAEFADLSTAGIKAAKDQAAAMEEVSEAARKAATWQGKFGSAVTAGTQQLGAAAKHAKGIAGDLAEGTRWLLKWTGISSGLAGLVGAGSLFGLDRLAAGVADRRYTAQGLGIGNSTNQQAFSLAYRRIVDPASFLGQIADARTDYSKRKTFTSLGIGEDQLNHLDTAQLGELVLQRAQTLWKSLPDHSQQTASAFGLTDVLSIADLRRLLAADSGLGKEGAENEKYQRQLYVPDRQQAAFQDFSVQLAFAGDKVANAFLDAFGNAHLPEELSKLSDSAASAITTFLEAPQLKIWLDDLGTGLKTTATFLASDQFNQDIGTFVTGIGVVAGALKSAEDLIPDVYKKFLGIVPDPDKGTTQYNPDTGMSKGPGDLTWHFGAPPAGAKITGGGGNTAPIGPGPNSPQSHTGFWGWLFGDHSKGGAPAAWTPPTTPGNVSGIRSATDPRGMENSLRQSAARYGFNPDDVVALARAEGLGTQNYATMDKGAYSYGALQMHVGGLADEFQKATHLDPSLPENEQALNDWGLWYASQHGFGKWSAVSGGGVPAPRRVAQSSLLNWLNPIGTANAAPMPGLAGGAPGAYGVPGAVMNYGGHGGVGAPGTNLVQVTTPDGKKYTINAAARDAFGGFVSDLEKTGYKIGSIGGFNMREKTGGHSLSEHAYGLAIDINPAQNAYGSTKTDMPANIHDIAAKWGLVWGGDWKSGPDPMHFQWGGSKPWLSASPAGAPPASASKGWPEWASTAAALNAWWNAGTDRQESWPDVFRNTPMWPGHGHDRTPGQGIDHAVATELRKAITANRGLKMSGWLGHLLDWKDVTPDYPFRSEGQIRRDLGAAVRGYSAITQGDEPATAPRLMPDVRGNVSGSVGNGAKVSIAVHNQTGGSAVISASQIAH
jgi:hypothetical protein